MRYIHNISIYKFNYFMKLIKYQMRKTNTILSRHLRVYSLFSYIVWLLLIGAFLRTTWHLSYLIWNQSGYGNDANLAYYKKHWKPTIHTVPRLTDAMLNLWPMYIAKDVLPSHDVALISFSSQPPFPLSTSQSNSVTGFDEREQYRVFLTNVLHGLITRLIWIYPSSKQSSVNQFYKKSQFYVGLAQINLVLHVNSNNNTNNESNANFPSTIITFCLCNAIENFCHLPLLPSSTTLHVPRHSCSMDKSLIYEELVDLMAESLLTQGKTERMTKDSVYLFSRESYFQSHKLTPSKSSTTSPRSYTSSSHRKLTAWINNLFILHIDMNYFIESITTVKNTSSDLSAWFIDYLQTNSSNDNNVNLSTYKPLLKNSSLTSHESDNYDVDDKVNSSNDNPIRINPASLIHQYTTQLKNVYNKLSLMEKNYSIDNVNQLIDSMLRFMTTAQHPNMLSYWSNDTLISSLSCCYLKPSVESISLNSNGKIQIFNQWKDKYRTAFYFLDNYCSYSDAMINVLSNKLNITTNAKEELSSLWNWLCALNAIKLKFISQFVACTYKNDSSLPASIGLCTREKSTSISFDKTPISQRNSLTLHRLQNIIMNLRRPLLVNLVMHPSWKPIVHEIHLSTELCKLLDKYVLTKHG
ncbi:unnamed protein product [Schistosoma turkestanicum]|nr:unnamed protein product [Schistosoma turkestanicum]